MKVSRARAALALTGAAIGAVGLSALIGGCGDNYRPVVQPVTGNGPAPQPASYAAVVSTTGSNTDGIVTIIDYSGDSVMVEATIGPGPTAFTLDELGGTGYTVNSDGTISNFAISTSLQSKNVTNSTVPPTSHLVNLMPPSSGLWATDLNDSSNNCDNNCVDIFSGSPQAFQRAVPVTGTLISPNTMPVFIAGAPNTTTGQREYVLTQNVPDTAPMTCNLSPTTVATDGAATPIEIATNTTDPAIPVGKCPVYAVQTPDLQRLFVLNRGDDTITVINSKINTLDTGCPKPTGCTNQNGQTYFTHPVLPLSTTAVTATGVTPPNGTAGMTAVAGPVYAEYNTATSQLVVADYDGGTISVIDVSLDEYGNDSSTFGTTYTVAVGNTTTPNPASVTVLYDGSKAYTANQNDDSGTGDGTVTVVNLSTHTVEKTITVVGHPRTVINTQNSEYAKIYVASPDSPYITIIESSPSITDLIDTTVLLEGTVVDVRTTTQNGTGGNNNYSSRVPGYGQPCNLSPSAMVVEYGLNYTLAECQAIP
jgi:DNA-binding beta-propeller fold protein YncE